MQQKVIDTDQKPANLDVVVMAEVTREVAA
jgi:hypothetical protein